MHLPQDSRLQQSYDATVVGGAEGLGDCESFCGLREVNDLLSGTECRHPPTLFRGVTKTDARPIRRSNYIVRTTSGTPPSFQSDLNAPDERFEPLAECERHPPPAAEAEQVPKTQMPKQTARDPHLQIGRGHEVERALAPGHVLLLKIHLLVRTMERAPIANTALQRPKLADTKTSRVALLEHLEDRRRLQNALENRSERRHDFALPNVCERINRPAKVIVADHPQLLAAPAPSKTLRPNALEPSAVASRHQPYADTTRDGRARTTGRLLLKRIGLP
jgi:hypothetical protein